MSKEKFWGTFEMLFVCRCRYGESHAYKETTKTLRLFESQNRFRLTCSDIKSEHFEKPEKSFPILSCFWCVVYTLQSMVFAACNQCKERDTKKKTGKPFPSFRWIQYLKNRYEMKAKKSEYFRKWCGCCKNTTKGKMRFLYRRKNFDREVKINQFWISIKFYRDCPGGYFQLR